MIDPTEELTRELEEELAHKRNGATVDEPDDPADGEPAESPLLTQFVLNRSALRELPEPQPLIRNVLDQGTVALLYGMWGTCKSFIALDWAASVATGRAWQGRDTEQMRVLYVAGEGAFGIAKRIDAWESGWGRLIADGSFDVLPRAVNLTSWREVNELAALIDWNGYGFIIFDTLARCMVGADENSAKDVGVVVDALGRLQKATPSGLGVITGVHHSGKDGKTFRGSSAFESAGDTVYSVTRDGGVVVLDREKRKDGPILDTHRLTLDPIEGTGSCVISLHRGVEKLERAKVLLSTFLHHFSTTGCNKGELRKVSELSEGTFYRALSDLLESGDLINTGTDKRPFYKAGR